MLKLLKFITGVVFLITFIILVKLFIIILIKSNNKNFSEKLSKNGGLFPTHFVNQFVFLWSPMTRVNGQQMIALSGVGPGKFEIDPQDNEKIIRFQKDLITRRKVYMNQLDDEHAVHSIILDAIFQNRENSINPHMETSKKNQNGNPKDEREIQQTMNENPLHNIARQAAFQSFKQDGLLLPTLYQELTNILVKNLFAQSLYLVKLDLFFKDITTLPFRDGHELYMLHFLGNHINLYEVARSDESQPKKTRRGSNLPSSYYGVPLQYMNSFDLGVDSALSFSNLIRERGFKLQSDTLGYVEPHASFYSDNESEN